MKKSVYKQLLAEDAFFQEYIYVDVDIYMYAFLENIM